MDKQKQIEPLLDDCLGRVQSLVRAFGILDQLAKHDEALNLTQLARLVQLPRSTAHRLLTTMWGLGYVEFDRAKSRWSVGVQAFAVGNAFAQTRDLGRLGRPIMRSLMLEACETVNISVPDEQGVRYLAQVQAQGARPTFARPGASLPMHTTASGKVLMAHWLPEEIDAFLNARQLDRRTQHSITDPNRLLAQLKVARERGYAVDDQENAEGIRCVAAAVFDEHGRPKASLSISGAISRLGDERIDRLGRRLSAAAQHMTTNIGGHAAF